MSLDTLRTQLRTQSGRPGLPATPGGQQAQDGPGAEWEDGGPTCRVVLVPPTSSWPPVLTWPARPQDLATLLEQIGCLKYLQVFEEQDVDLRIFLTLTESDLKEIGIT